MPKLELALTIDLLRDDESCDGCRFMNGVDCWIFDQKIIRLVKIDDELTLTKTLRCPACKAAEKLLRRMIKQGYSDYDPLTNKNQLYDPRCIPAPLPPE